MKKLLRAWHLLEYSLGYPTMAAMAGWHLSRFFRHIELLRWLTSPDTVPSTGPPLWNFHYILSSVLGLHLVCLLRYEAGDVS
jgi:hypothetical protein